MAMVTYRIAPLYCRPSTLRGISPRLIEDHYQRYGESVHRLNAVAREIAALAPDAPGDVVCRLRAHELALLNDALLHELYFASLGGAGTAMPGALAEVLARDFGSAEKWSREFAAVALALGGEGWALVSWIPRDARLVVHAGPGGAVAIAGAVPVLALDMHEHAWRPEFEAAPDAYVAAFMLNIDWVSVLRRHQEAVGAPRPPVREQHRFGSLPSISPEDALAIVEAGERVHFIDVRPREYTVRSPEIAEGAVWRDPDRVGEWIAELPKGEPVIAFCAYGFDVGCETAAALRQAGIDASYMTGGHYALKAIKGRMRSLP